ncbi:purple acid phosphatase family protein [Desertivirga xinjiangensis]|uniref:purple acid phosphatase family protein n=1 Tax=Desertivirga xinjiangensis TaxID=539206 RepID=UPI00210DD8E7|nr:tartrate-resistant acid phosphatase type 5 family protein [Pedobacter xinjiangensis]
MSKIIAEEKASGYQGGFIESLQVNEDALNFLVIGDWGRNGQYHQTSVAKQLANAAITLDSKFIISTGDNFYPNGVQSISDPLWKTSFEDVYNDFPLLQDWNVVLGNHDYRSNPAAQIAYSAISGRWNMPDYYFSQKLSINDDATQKVLFVYIDTNPFVKKYYKDDDYKKQVSKQDTAAQKTWINSVLSDPDPAIKWRIVVGHHPLYCGGKRVKSLETFDIRNCFEPLFKKYKVDAYLCGHEHDLQHIKPAGQTHYFVSGAGCEVRPTGKLPESRFAKADFGFMTFSISPDNMLVQVVNDRGEVIYTDNIKKKN